MSNFKYRITFIADGLPITGNTIYEKALGGSETALIYVAKEFQKLGHQVTVYCNCTQEGIYDGVEYQSNKKVDQFKTFFETDILIVSRHYGYLTSKYNSKLNILWNHDILADNAGLAQAQWNIDFMWCLSEFHKQNFVAQLPDIEPILKIAANGFDPNITKTTAKKKHQVMFTSRPERGLLKALELFSKYNDKTLKLIICNYSTIADPEVTKIENMCAVRIQQLIEAGFNIEVTRYIKKDLYKVIAESKAILYPTEFPEIFCISALEAQANGTAFITSHEFAMKEIVAYDGIPLTTEYDNLFITRLESILSNVEKRKEYEKLGLEHAKQFMWKNVVKNMLSDIEQHLFERNNDVLGKTERLYYESDFVVGRDYAKQKGLDTWVNKFDNDLRFVEGKESLKEAYEEPFHHESERFDVESWKKSPRTVWVSDMVKQLGIKNMLDYACHKGTASIFAAMNNEDLKVVGYDISENVINSAKNRVKNQCPELLDRLTLTAEKPEGKYDAILLGEILEHVYDFRSFVDELCEKHLNDGGKVLITLPRGGWEHLTRIKNQPNDVQFHVHSFDQNDIESIFAGTDYLIQTTHCGETYYGESIGHYMFDYTYKKGFKLGLPATEKKLHLIRPYQGITACMIARNAEKSIERLLDSIYEHVDYIKICLDHLPGENEVFERRIKEYDKNNRIEIDYLPERIVSDRYGFGAARNFSVKDVKTKWILWIDSDEELICRDKLRRYMENSHINAFAVPQHHQQLDCFIPADNPNRLYRTGKGEFVGFIHEQVMCLDDINEPITPSLKMSTANILNFGELTENMRRDKALNRNLSLLERDAQVNVDQRRKEGLPVRKLTPILIMRDMVNRIKWGAEEMGTYRTRDALEHCLPRIMKLWETFYKEETDDLYYNEAKKQVQEALVLTQEGKLYHINDSADNKKVICIRNKEIPVFEEFLKRIY